MCDQGRKYSPDSTRSHGRQLGLPLINAMCALWVGGLATSIQADGLGGGGSINQQQCVSQSSWQQILDEVRRNQTVTVSPRTDGPPPKFTFHPMGGRLYRDLFTHNFVDLSSASPDILDWDCTDFTYDGHDASDVHIRTFGEQAVGVPVFAAQDGRVVGVTGGCDDLNTCPFAPCSDCVNYVALDNDFGRVTFYLHLKKNSATVALNQVVRAGDPLGLVGSSGFSSSPHLHFATYDHGAVFEPYAGPCRAGESGWKTQTPINRQLYLRDAGVTYENMENYPGYPHEFPRSGQIALADSFIYFWALPINLPANSTWRFRIQKPNGAIVFNTGNQGFQGGSIPFMRASWWWWSWNVPEMHTTVGTWIVRFDINGVQRAALPVEVRTARTSDFNRPPAQINVAISPASPSINDVLVCMVNTDLLLDDLDYSIVRYRYEWLVDGQVVRDVTTAAHSDALAHHSAPQSSLVECRVTPNDGTVNGPIATRTVTICVSPAIQQDPLGAVLCEGDSWTLSAVASGTPPLSFQWRHDGAPIPGATATNYSLVGSAGTEGTYDVSVTNGCTTVFSQAAEVLVATVDDCDDQSVCTIDSCAVGVCKHVPSTASECDDGEYCTVVDECASGICAGMAVVIIYGDVAPPIPDGVVELLDLECVLYGYLNLDLCPRGDIAPCGGDGVLELTDVLNLLDAYYGLPACPDPCPG